MSRLIATISCLAMGLSIGACKKDDAAKPAAEETETPTTPETPETPVVEEPLATSLDFEDEAESEITTENYEDALASLEAELASEE